MNLPIKGSCQCGIVNYALNDHPILTYAWHCSDCQKRTGSAFSLGTIISPSALALEGELTSWERTSDTGSINTRYSCKRCGNIIYGVGSLTPEIFKLQPGTLNDTCEVLPEVHLWTKRAQRWVSLDSDTKDSSGIITAALQYRESLRNSSVLKVRN